MSRGIAKLESTLEKIDGTGYGAYNEIRGPYGFDHFDLEVEHVQGDPTHRPPSSRPSWTCRRAASRRSSTGLTSAA